MLFVHEGRDYDKGEGKGKDKDKGKDKGKGKGKGKDKGKDKGKAKGKDKGKGNLGAIWEQSGSNLGPIWGRRPRTPLGGKMCQNHTVFLYFLARPTISSREFEGDPHRLR